MIQRLLYPIFSIYDRTVPKLFTRVESQKIEDKDVIIIYVDKSKRLCGTSSGEYYKRLGKNSKPYTPEKMKAVFDEDTDYSSQIIDSTSEDDINLLEVYKLKEKLKTRDRESTLAELDDMSFLKNLSLIKETDEGIKLTVAGLLFVGKELSIQKLMPQAECIYLHYSDNNTEEYDSRLDLKLPIISVLDRLTEKIQNFNHLINIQVGLFRLEIYDFSEKVFQEALLNAYTHRRYDSPGSIYVKHYSDKLVIESPGGFLADINENNIITHPSLPRNKLIAETLQRLRYVQRSGQGIDIIFKEMLSMGKPYPEYTVYNDAIRLTLYSATEDTEFVKFIAETQDKRLQQFSLSELMIMRYLYENKEISLSQAAKLTQLSINDVRHSLRTLENETLIEVSGKVYMLTAQTYDRVKSDVKYVQDKAITYLKAKSLILDYLETHESINNEKIRMLCRCSKKQASTYTKKMRDENILEMIGKSINTKYVKK
ncbi:MAG TPA: hypothetical protein H9980_03175 [Candidatus Erysipelatoclostridium merdavium]|uniref:ATP-dependent DNA helicase RecG C-terminal domain-containing protein n=1 Tax=Candidatus Erysipelatoclostridium merdavium TaxID=2838566 RepID=A0A9D1XKT6_9FIRM|nr:hypothetical protein [Candidatus Erysipelatoclostridium merdavium]